VSSALLQTRPTLRPALSFVLGTSLAALAACATSATAQRSPRSEGAGSETATPSGAPLRILEGRASYYADSLAGRPTASGEPYDPRALTAASRDLPFGTIVRVVRLSADGRELGRVTVRINDRGPHRDLTRILDLSRAAAEELDMIRAGVVPIRAEVLSEP